MSGLLQSVESQRVGHDLATEQQQQVYTDIFAHVIIVYLGFLLSL